MNDIMSKPIFIDKYLEAINTFEFISVLHTQNEWVTIINYFFKRNPYFLDNFFEDVDISSEKSIDDAIDTFVQSLVLPDAGISPEKDPPINDQYFSQYLISDQELEKIKYPHKVNTNVENSNSININHNKIKQKDTSEKFTLNDVKTLDNEITNEYFDEPSEYEDLPQNIEVPEDLFDDVEPNLEEISEILNAENPILKDPKTKSTLSKNELFEKMRPFYKKRLRFTFGNKEKLQEYNISVRGIPLLKFPIYKMSDDALDYLTDSFIEKRRQNLKDNEFDPNLAMEWDSKIAEYKPNDLYMDEMIKADLTSFLQITLKE